MTFSHMASEATEGHALPHSTQFPVAVTKTMKMNTVNVLEAFQAGAWHRVSPRWVKKKKKNTQGFLNFLAGDFSAYK